MPSTKIRRIDFYPDDWLAGTLGMPGDEIGAYIQICALIYAHGGPVLDDESHLAKVCGMHWRHFRRVRISLLNRGKITSENGHVAVKRCAEELQRRLTMLSEASQNGTKGNKIRWNGIATRYSAAIANNLQSTEDSESLPFFLTESESQNPKHTHGAKRAVSRRVYAKDFERFWEVYPHRSGDPKKPAADKFGLKVKAGISPEEIIFGAGRYAAHVSEQKIELRFVPQAAAWLHQERWNDEFNAGPANGHDRLSVERPTSEAERQSALAEIMDDLKQRGLIE